MLRVFMVLIWCSIYDANDVPITWWSSPRAWLPCVVPGADRIPARRPPPPLDDERPRPKLYVWTRNGEEVKSFRILNNGTLEVPKKKDGSAEGVYQCAVKHQAGFVLGYPVHLKFVHLDKQITVEPDHGTGRIGQPFVFKCKVNSGPAATITWLKDGEPLPHDDRFHLLNNELLILDIAAKDAGSYRCKATNSQANKTRTSHAGRLEVVQAEDQEIGFLPVHHESVVKVPDGRSVVLACPVVGWPRPELIWEFVHPGDKTHELEVIDEVLALRRVDLSAEGLYTCRVAGRSDLVKNFNVTVTEPPKITLPPQSKLALRASTVRFNCTATGRPTPVVTWYKDGQPLTLTGTIAVVPSVGNKRKELLIRSVTSEDAGIYQCVAQNSAGTWSAWAALNVSGAGAAPPAGVRCAPVGPRSVAVHWDKVPQTIVAYTVQITSPDARSLPWRPTQLTEEIVAVNEALAPYAFQVRVYLQSKISPASDMSPSVTCQGQGVPIKVARFGDEILVSWKPFAEQTPGVKEWILQYKTENSSNEHNVTLQATDYNYTLHDIEDFEPLQIRVLGTKVLPWLHQNLTLVPWFPTSAAGQGPEDGELKAIPQDVEVTDVGPRDFTVRWRCEEADNSPEQYSYMICIRKLDGNDQMCFESFIMSAHVDNLSPNSEYEVRVQARVPTRNALGEFTEPLYISTLSDGPQRFKELTYKFVNASALRVSWNSVPDRYMVHYSNELKLPISQWLQVETMGNTVLLTDLDLTRELYVMVTGYEPLGRSPILHVPVQVPEVKDLDYSYTPAGELQVTWKGAGPRIVRYSQNLTQVLDQWRTLNVTGNRVIITGLQDGQTYVMVAAPGLNARSRVLNVPPRPHAKEITSNSTVYIVVGVLCGLLLLILLAITAVCLWRGIKRIRSPTRTRRRNESGSQGNDEDDAEMTNIGGRLANGGGSKDAGEPLLNGHVHITENPNSKTPNGRVRAPRPCDALDVARYDAHPADTTLDTTLDATLDACATLHLLDTSRAPEHGPSRSSRSSRELGDDSFNKLPDDNMNSELTRSADFQIDNGKVLPTLQPNG